MAQKTDTPDPKTFNLKQYGFRTTPIPRLSIQDPETQRRIAERVWILFNVLIDYLHIMLTIQIHK